MNKYKTLALNTIIFAVGSFSAKFLQFLLTRLYTGTLCDSDFNIKEMLEITANLLIPVFTFSIAEALLRFGLGREHDKKTVLSNAVFIELCGLALLLLCAPLLGMLSYTDGFLTILIVYICTSSYRQICAQFVRVRGLLKLYALDGILTSLTLFIFNLIFMAWLDMGIRGFFLSVILSDFCSGTMLCICAKIPRYFSFSAINPRLMRTMLRFSVALTPAAVLWIITGFADRFFLREMVSDGAAGVYGAATKVPNLISMVATVFFQAWNISAIVENDSKGREKFYTRVFSAYQSIMVIAAAFLIALVQPLSMFVISTKKDADYANAYLYTPVLVVAVLMMCYNQFLSSVYTATKHTRNSLWTSAVAAGVNLVLNAILIPKWGVQGAAIATLASYLACYCIRIVDARRYVPFDVNHVEGFVNFTVLLVMCYVVVAGVPMYPVYLGCGVVFLTAMNYRAIIQTLKKILRRS